MKAIDAHSHFGYSCFSDPTCDYPTYSMAAESNGIVYTVATSTPSPEHHLPNGQTLRPCIWKLDGESIKYVQQILSTERILVEEKPALRNPYQLANDEILQLATQTRGNKN